MRRILPLVIGILALVGILDSAYLALNHFGFFRSQHLITSACELAAGSCQAVDRSSESMVLGVPNAVLGGAYYSFVLAVAIVRIHTGKWLLPWILPAILLGGLAYSGFLSYTMIADLDTLCPYCMAAHTANAAIVILYTASRWLDHRASVASGG